MLHIGIDLGKDGGIVVLTPEIQIVEKYKTPLLRAGTKKGRKQGRDEYDVPEMRRILSLYRKEARVTLEKSQPMPMAKGGTVANYQRGFSFGLWQGLLSGLEIPYDIVTPQAWQKSMFEGLAYTDTKQASIIVASRLWPNEDWRRSDLAVKPDDGLTDAALLGLFGMRRSAVSPL